MARHLHVVDTATGELQEACEACAPLVAELRVQLEGANRDRQAWIARYAELKAAQDVNVEEDPLWGDVKDLFAYWRAECRHPRSRFGADRFRLAKPYVEKYGVALCRRAVRGAAFDPYITRRRNGTSKRHDGWELIFRDKGRFEEFCNRAPVEEETAGG